MRAVIAASCERIDRSNLVGMGVLPLQFADSEDAGALDLDGSECYTIEVPSPDKTEVEVTASDENGGNKRFRVRVRIDTPKQWVGVLPP